MFRNLRTYMPLPLRPRGKLKVLALCLLFCLSIPLTYVQGQYTDLMLTPRSEMPQYRFAEIIQKASDREGREMTLLNYGFLDGGFYYASGAVPASRYFCTLNLDLKEMQEEMDKALQGGIPDFVVIRGNQKRNLRNYVLLDTCSFPFEHRNWSYSLWAKKSLADGL